MPQPTVAEVNSRILGAVKEQIAEQQQTTSKLTQLALLSAGFEQLVALLKPYPGSAAIAATLDKQRVVVDGLQDAGSITELGSVLAALYGARLALKPLLDGWLASNQANARDTAAIDTMALDLIARTRQLLSARPDVSAIMDDLTALKNLRGGPADAVAFHDFHTLQIASKTVWLHAFDSQLKSQVEQLYQQVVEISDQSSVAMPPLDAIEDVQQLRELLNGLGETVAQAGSQPIPTAVSAAFPGSDATWVMLSPSQQSALLACADIIGDPSNGQPVIDFYRLVGKDYLGHPAGPVDRLSRLMLEIGNALNEPYAFDIYAPSTYNFGLLVTYRQRWDPQEYQAGDLVATIPLAPNETRKFSKKQVVKTNIARKIAEKSSSQRSIQSSEDSRAEAEIMQRSSTASNFKMTSNGKFNIGIGSMSVTNEFGGNTEAFSSSNRKGFHEATLKAAEEYRLERSMEVDTSSSVEGEESATGEISNPNNEITVTYLFYELQRRFKIYEYLYRARPVILIAQDVPEPHQIDEAWLLQYKWIIARVLLDEGFRDALTYLTTGFAGDEVSASVLQASWEKQRDLLDKLEALTDSQLASRNALRERIISQTLAKDEFDDSTHGLGLLDSLTDAIRNGDFTFSNITKADASAEELDNNRKAAQARLKYVEEALADAQDKLKAATSAFEAATKAYTEAMQNKFNRHTAIDQLRLHVKQNIIYYMQAIWAHEVPDQRYFRLHKMPVSCPAPQVAFNPVIAGTYGSRFGVTLSPTLSAANAVDHEHELGEIADLDNPLGYKGNYIIYPLLTECSLTKYMLADYVDSYLGIKDPDAQAPQNFDPETFDLLWQDAVNDPGERDRLRGRLIDYIAAVRNSTDEIIVPTGNLFIEALPGAHPILEDFKLLHRMEDLLKAKSDTRTAELENLRLAARLTGSAENDSLLDDPKIDKKIVVSGVANYPPLADI